MVMVTDEVFGRGELMRRAISCASSGNLDSVMMIRDFMLEMHQHLSTLNLKTKDFETKMNTLLACIDKVETACYKRFIRKQEFPDELQIPETLLEGRLADGDTDNPDQYVQGSTWH
jgi:predicted translin family RNA/ssDNA-binding protein